MNEVSPRFAYLQVSAEAHALHPEVVGYGVETWWPDGLGIKINALRRFVMQNFGDDDVLVFVDAFDVVVFAKEEEILSKFEDIEKVTNRSLVINAEETCFPSLPEICDNATYPQLPTRWRYLNSGLLVGRGFALKAMLRDPVPDVMPSGDQLWFHQYYHTHRHEMVLDTNCSLGCTVLGLDLARNGAHLKDGRVAIPETGTLPAFVHFPGPAHWPRWRSFRATSLLQEAFRELYPKESERLLEGWWVGARLGSTHDIVLYQGPPYWSVIRGVQCIKCNLLGDPSGECRYFRGLLCDNCASLSAVMAPLVLALCALVWRCAGLSCPGRQSGFEPPPSPMQGLLRRALIWLRSRLKAPHKVEPAV